MYLYLYFFRVVLTVWLELALCLYTKHGFVPTYPNHAIAFLFFHLILPISYRPTPEQSFRPGGILPAKTNPVLRTEVKPKNTLPSKKSIHSSNSSSTLGSMNLQSLNLTLLNEELKRTEEAMQRQQLKIKLNTKQPKRFEAPKNDRRQATKEEIDSPY